MIESPIEALRLGEAVSIGRTAGNGREGAGEADRRKDGEEPKEDRRLCVSAVGGSIGGDVRGVPGADGAGEAIAKLEVAAFD